MDFQAFRSTMNVASESGADADALGMEGLRLDWLEAGSCWVSVAGLEESHVVKTVCSCSIEKGFAM